MESQKRVFCTVFDKNYLYQGVVLYRSLLSHSPDFVLYCLALDEVAVKTLESLQYPHLKVVSLSQLNQGWIEWIKQRTTYGQFCWSMQPVLCHYILEIGEPSVTYLEADSCFFSNPEPLFQELSQDSISLSPHWFTPKFEYLGEQSGKYCTQFNYFKNDDHGRACLEYWREQNFEYRKELPYEVPGQYCLNYFEEKFKGVHVLTNRGAGVAPWNVQQYTLSTKDGVPQVNGKPVIFYHFHQLGSYLEEYFDLGTYPLSETAIDLFYRPYLKELRRVEVEVRVKFPDFNFKKRILAPPSIFKSLFTADLNCLKKAVRGFQRKWFGNYNVIKG